MYMASRQISLPKKFVNMHVHLFNHTHIKTYTLTHTHTHIHTHRRTNGICRNNIWLTS